MPKRKLRLLSVRTYPKAFEDYYRRAEAPAFWSVVEEARFKRAMYNAWKAGRRYGSVVPILVRRMYRA